MKKKGFIISLFFTISTFTSGTITITKLSDPSLGIVLSGNSGRQFILGTNSSVTGSASSDYISGASAGNLTIGDDSAPLTIVITASNISSTGGLTANRILCSYNGGAETRCDGAGYTVSSVSSATLLIGVDLTTNQVHTGGSSGSVSFDLDIVYQ